MSHSKTGALNRVPPPTRHKKVRRLSANAAAVLAALQDEAQPMKAYDLLSKLREVGIHAPMSVYRALDQLIERRLVRKIQSLNAFMALPSEIDGAVAFIICSGCGSVETEEIGSSGLDWLGQRGIASTEAYIEGYRPCNGCDGVAA